MHKVWVNVTGPLGATEDDLINGGREAIARAGYQVGDVTDAGTSVNSTTEMLLECYVEVDERLHDEFERTGEIDLEHGDYAVWAHEERDHELQGQDQD